MQIEGASDDTAVCLEYGDPIQQAIPRDLVLERAQLGHVKVVLRHVLGRVDLRTSVSGYKLVT